MTATATLTPPAAHPRSTGTRQVNVRFDEPTRFALEVVAIAQDRTLTQLVRYAMTWWINTPLETQRSRTVSPTDSTALDGQHVNVRLPVVLLDQLDLRANITDGTDRSTVIRAAVRAWLRADHVPALIQGTQRAPQRQDRRSATVRP
jgi:Arc/MetJ-type ribon-helix-helix transcriptional regulator